MPLKLKEDGQRWLGTSAAPNPSGHRSAAPQFLTPEQVGWGPSGPYGAAKKAIDPYFGPPTTSTRPIATTRTPTSSKKEDQAMRRVKVEEDSDSESAIIRTKNVNTTPRKHKDASNVYATPKMTPAKAHSSNWFSSPPIPAPQFVATTPRVKIESGADSQLFIPIKPDDTAGKGGSTKSKKIFPKVEPVDDKNDPFTKMGSSFEGVDAASRFEGALYEPETQRPRAGKERTSHPIFERGAEPVSPPQSERKKTRVTERALTNNSTPTKVPRQKSGRSSQTGNFKAEDDAQADIKYLQLPTPPSSRGATAASPTSNSQPPSTNSSTRLSPISVPVPIDHASIASTAKNGILGYLCHTFVVTGFLRKLYQTPSGETLEWYQSRDLEILLAEHAVRYVLRITGNVSVLSMLLGKILNYEMGLGKTHVACALIDRDRLQRLQLNKMYGINAPLKPDLIIAAKSIIPQWVEHLKRLSHGKLTVAVYPGGSKDGVPIPIPDADVIICNKDKICPQYSKLRDEMDRIDREHVENGLEPRDWTNLTKKETAALERIAPMVMKNWNIIAVDECHQNGMNNSGTVGGRTLLTMKADNSLLLSGTPAQNGLEDMQLYYAVLQDPSKRKDFREAEKHRRFLNKAMKRSTEMRPAEVIDLIGEREVSRILPDCIITRKVTNPVTGTSLVVLPIRHNYVVEVSLSEEEWKLYKLKGDTEDGFVKLLRLRQVCLHGHLVRKTLLVDTPEDKDEEKLKYEDMSHKYDTKPKDRARILKLLPSNEIIWDQISQNEATLPPSLKKAGIDKVLNDEYISSKFKAVYKILKKVPKSEKTIIFSMFTSLLDVLAVFLDDVDIGFVQYDGRMTDENKAKALNTIATNKKCDVILVSMKAGGTGLNITACNHAIIFDPWWNPYTEEQAISRIYRIRQSREVHVYRILCPGTVEDRISEIQNKKRTTLDMFFNQCAALTHSRDLVFATKYENSPLDEPVAESISGHRASSRFGPNRRR